MPENQTYPIPTAEQEIRRFAIDMAHRLAVAVDEDVVTLAARIEKYVLDGSETA